MVWCKPTRTAGGIVFWETVEENDYFVKQKHITQGKSVSAAFVGLRSIWLEAAGTYRIVLAQRPHHTIAESKQEQEVHKNITRICHIYLPLFLLIP